MTNNYEAYLWAYFTGDGDGQERVSLAVSKGNDALSYIPLNGGKPMFVSKYGSRGLRDPFILRKQDGGFAIIATDLNVAALRKRFDVGQCVGSRYLEIWESNDLVHWSDQRHVLVSPENAGNSWAPEAYWDEERGAYAVYWASNLFDGERAAHPELREQPTYNRMMLSFTKDFREFSDPMVWVDVCRGTGHEGFGTIDVTLAHANGYWYRFIKDEGTMQVRQERSPRLEATEICELSTCESAENGWRLINPHVGTGLPNGETDEHGEPVPFTCGEGPCVFSANPGDVNGFRWFLFIDQPDYHGGPNHYIGFASNDLDDPNGWMPVGDKLRAGLPVNADGGRPRHGTVAPITEGERQRLLEAFA